MRHTNRFTVDMADATTGGLLALNGRARDKHDRPTTADPMPLADVAGVLAYLAKGTTTRLQLQTPFFRQSQINFSQQDLLAAFAKIEIGKPSERPAARALLKSWGFSIGRTE